MTGAFSLAQNDAINYMSLIDDGSVDCIVTDPAYESLEKHRKVGTTTRLAHSKSSSNDWFPIFPNSRYPEFFDQAFRVMKDGSHLYVFSDQETMFAVKPMGEAAGFKFWKPIVWDKLALGMGYHYRCRYEFILFFEKGKRNLNSHSEPDVLRYKRVNNGFPTEKPVELAQVLIRQSTEPGELVVDPFMGSGAFGVAALQLGRRFSGCDIESKAIAIASSRLLMEQAIGETMAAEGLGMYTWVDEEDGF